MVIWITGISGAGKTTLCEALWGILKPKIPQTVMIDGDVIRACFGGDLGYREPDRHVQIKRIQNLSKVLSDQKCLVLVAALYAHPDLLAWNRTHINEYFEIYLKVSLNTVRKRDIKGLYGKADCGEITDVVGLDIPWHAPENSHYVANMDHPEDPVCLAQRIIQEIPQLKTLECV